MSRTPIVRPWDRSTSKLQYDAFIAAVGYERRARYIAETLDIKANKKLAAAFPDRKVYNYNENSDWFAESYFEVDEVKGESFGDWCEHVFADIRSDKLTEQKICIDISSLDRFRIAVLVDKIRKLDWNASIKVDFLYSLAKFSPPPTQIAPNRIVGPVLPSFAGWTDEPDKPPVAIVGLGYEQDKALGAVEHIQAAEVWAFIPVSKIRPYSGALVKANSTLLESIAIEHRLFYLVDKPLDCFATLESLTNRILKSSFPILFPFGPKMFTLCTLLVACLYPNVAVWRVSAGNDEEAIDRIPSGYIYGLSVEFPEQRCIRENTLMSFSEN